MNKPNQIDNNECPTRELDSPSEDGMNGEKLEFINKQAGYRRITEETREELDWWTSLEEYFDNNN